LVTTTPHVRVVCVCACGCGCCSSRKHADQRN
jgi:hypothetical protein